MINNDMCHSHWQQPDVAMAHCSQNFAKVYINFITFTACGNNSLSLHNKSLTV